MATYIENQPVFFGEEDPCNADELPYVQLVDVSDVTQFQMRLDVCGTATDLISNPAFESDEEWSLSDGWNIAGGLLCCDESATGAITNSYDFNDDLYYKIEVTVYSMSPGGSLQVKLGATVLGYITTTGTFYFYGQPTDFFGFSYFSLVPYVEGTIACVSEVNAYNLPLNNIVNVYNDAGTLIESLSYEDDPGSFALSGNKMTVSINWGDLGITSGCHYLCWLDACSNDQGQNYPAVISNCNFSDLLRDWDFGDYWTPDTDQAHGDNPGGPVSPGVDTISQDDIFQIIGINNCVQVVVSSFTGSGSLQVYFGTVLVKTITAAGTYSVCGVPDVNQISLVLNGEVEVMVNSVCPLPVVTANNDCDYISNTFKIGSYASACTLKIGIANNNSGFGFDYTTFAPSVRVEGKLRQSKYKGDRSAYKDTKGGRKVNYFDATKYKDLVTEQQPEYVHDFLRLMIGSDILYINNAAYYAEDEEYNITRDNSQDEMGSVSVLVARQNQNVKNSFCSSNENNGTCEGNFLLLEDGESIAL